MSPLVNFPGTPVVSLTVSLCHFLMQYSLGVFSIKHRHLKISFIICSFRLILYLCVSGSGSSPVSRQKVSRSFPGRPLHLLELLRAPSCFP